MEKFKFISVFLLSSLLLSCGSDEPSNASQFYKADFLETNNYEMPYYEFFYYEEYLTFLNPQVEEYYFGKPIGYTTETIKESIELGIHGDNTATLIVRGSIHRNAVVRNVHQFVLNYYYATYDSQYEVKPDGVYDTSNNNRIIELQNYRLIMEQPVPGEGTTVVVENGDQITFIFNESSTVTSKERISFSNNNRAYECTKISKSQYRII